MGSAKDRHEAHESFAKVTSLFAKNGCSRLKMFDQQPYNIYIYPCIEFSRLGCACIIFKRFNAIILAQVELTQNSMHCFFFLGLGKG